MRKYGKLNQIIIDRLGDYPQYVDIGELDLILQHQINDDEYSARIASQPDSPFYRIRISDMTITEFEEDQETI